MMEYGFALKVRKLASLGIRTSCVAEKDDITSAENVRFGMSIFHIHACHMLLIIVHACYLLVFMSPETATKSPWRDFFGSQYFLEHAVLVAVDEAHCIHEWLDM